MRRRLAQFNRAQVWSPPGETVGDVRYRNTPVDHRSPGLQPEIEVFRVIKLLDSLDIPAVQARHVHEGVVIDQEAVSILFGRLLILLQRLVLPVLRYGRGSRNRREHSTAASSIETSTAPAGSG